MKVQLTQEEIEEAVIEYVKASLPELHLAKVTFRIVGRDMEFDLAAEVSRQ